MRRIHQVLWIMGLVLSLVAWVSASPVGKQHANQAAQGWLKHNTAPMETFISKNTHTMQEFADDNGRVLWYVVSLEPQGFVVLSADDEIEPVIVFSATGYFDGAQPSPLKALLERDMKNRLEYIGQKQAIRGGGKSEKSQKWQNLLDAGSDVQADEPPIVVQGFSSVSDVRVSPFLQTKWDQENAAGGYCYNYYTPNHYVTGCVATAMAQLMRYHSWPTAGIGVLPFTIQVDGYSQTAYTRGGNGSGGAYSWSQMPYDPQAGLTTTQREAIGALCYDAGVAVEMSYRSSGSSASVYDAAQALKNTFGYSNSIYGSGFSSSGDAGLWGMMNANLDASLPVILGISGSSGGHAVVADGYGYNSSTMYHHLNMGWGGQDDAWYQLPYIDSYYTFTTLTDCLYNAYPAGTGEIISGRITSMGGAPLDGVVVTACQGSTQVKQATTNSRGIYALKNLSSNIQYRLSALKSGYVFTDQYVTTGWSQDSHAVSGNKWAVNFIATNPMPPTAISKTAEVNSVETKTIVLDAIDDHLPNPPAAMTFTITSLPSHGTLSEPGVGQITAVPYTHTLANYGNTVSYVPCAYYGGQDSFTFKANDGGTAPAGGDSNIATVTVNVDNQLYVDYAVVSSVYSSFMFNTASYYDMRSEVIYLQSEIGSAKKLTDLALNIYTPPGRNLSNWTIRMQHTSWTSFSSPSTKFLTSGWTTVYQGTVTNTQSGWVNFHFQTPFVYNGTQNLLVDFSYNNTGLTNPSGGYFINQSAGTSRVLAIASTTGTHGDPLTWSSLSSAGSGYYTGSVPSVKLIGTVPIDPIAGDFDLSCDVKLLDLVALSVAWMTQLGQANYNPACDLSSPKDNAINLSDLQIFAGHWLEIYQP